MLDAVYFYNGKLFGLRGGEHRNNTVANLELGSNFIRFKDNLVKTFHGGLTDLKYEPRVVKHVCHPLNEKHESCLVELYRMYSRFIVRLQRITLSQIPNVWFTINRQWESINSMEYCLQ